MARLANSASRVQRRERFFLLPLRPLGRQAPHPVDDEVCLRVEWLLHHSVPSLSNTATRSGRNELACVFGCSHVSGRATEHRTEEGSAGLGDVRPGLPSCTIGGSGAGGELIGGREGSRRHRLARELLRGGSGRTPHAMASLIVLNAERRLRRTSGARDTVAVGQLVGEIDVLLLPVRAQVCGFEPPVFGLQLLVLFVA